MSALIAAQTVAARPALEAVRPRFSAFAPDLAHVRTIAADRLATLPADCRVEAGTMPDAGRLAALPAKLGIAVAPQLTLSRFSAPMTDCLVEFAAMDARRRHASLPASLLDGHFAPVFHCHMYSSNKRRSALQALLQLSRVPESSGHASSSANIGNGRITRI